MDRSKYKKFPNEARKQIPIFYVPIHPKDRDRRDCLSWSVIQGALTCLKVSSKLSKWLIPDKYWVSFPYGIFNPAELRPFRQKISSPKNFYVTHKGQTPEQGQHTSFSFGKDEFIRFRRQIRKGTGNFTSNIATLLSIPNSLLQGNIKQAGHATGSVIINTTVGIFGFLNPAEKIGLKPYKEDVGQTLASFGVGTGCYFVLPILGPTTARDSVGLIADTFLDPFAHITIRENELFGISGNKLDYYSIKGTTAIDFRSENIQNFDSLEKNSIDLYSSYKSLYLQDRENKVKNSITNGEDWDNLDN